MRIKWEAIFENEKRQFEQMNELERFVYFLLLQFGSPYGWGKENPEAADCSGAICMALYGATGLLVRTTADDLYRRFFTVKNPAGNMIRAAFFIDGKTGKVVHAAAFVDEGVALNAAEPGARVRSYKDIEKWFMGRGCTAAVRGLERKALVSLAGGGNVSGLDLEWGKYFE